VAASAVAAIAASLYEIRSSISNRYSNSENNSNSNSNNSDSNRVATQDMNGYNGNQVED